MKNRSLAFFLALALGMAPAQKAVHSEKNASAATKSNSSTREKPAAAAVKKTTHSEKFQQVAVALKLNNLQKKDVSTLVLSTRDQMAAIRADGSLTPAQRQQAVQAIELGLAQKFVGLLTPGQKKELATLLLNKQGQQSANKNAKNNSDSANSGGGGASAPNIPSIDAPSDSGSEDSGNSADAGDASSSQSSSSTGAASNTNSVAADPASNAAAGNTATGKAPAAEMVPVATAPARVTAADVKSGHISDAQLAAILNSFVQDEDSAAAGEKTNTQTTTQSGT